MFSFENDYSEGAHPEIMKEMLVTNEEQTTGYGLDPYCEQAVTCIKEKLGAKDADVHMLVGGTQTNLIAIASFLRPYEGVIAADTAHIAVHETGAIEATGHKVITVPTKDGKLTKELIQMVIESHHGEHMVAPKMVYVSNTTEVGTHYTKKELVELYTYCKENHLYFYIDGARLASALAVEGNTMLLCDYKDCCDAFYIGGTKNGALFGEALVIFNEELKPGIRHMIKQRGGLLAKGRLLGIQFKVLFQDDLYLKIGEHQNDMAKQLRIGLERLGYPFLYDSITNQLFPIFPNELIRELQEKFVISISEKVNEEYSCVRLVTSWATKEEAVESFLLAVSDYKEKTN